MRLYAIYVGVGIDGANIELQDMRIVIGYSEGIPRW